MSLIFFTLEPKTPAHADASNQAKWLPQFTVEYRPDRGRSLARFDAIVPLWQRRNKLFFTDLRYIDTSGTGMEGNLGLGYRKLGRQLPFAGGDWIWGGYAFFDRRKTPLENYFSQWTLGTELLAPNWSFRANGYLPQEDGFVVRSRTASSGSTPPTLSGTTVVSGSNGNTQVDKEWALPGFDAEVGLRFTTLPGHALWLYAGYFAFDRAETAEIAGPRARFEYRMQDLFDWNGSTLTLGAEIRDDKIGGTDGLVLARFSIPLGSGVTKQHRGFDRRMTEFIQRDVDVVTLVDVAEVQSAGSPTIVVDPQSGEILNVYIVNNDGTGDCTQDAPCRLTDVAQDQDYGSGDIIVLLDNSGNIVGDIDLTQNIGALGSDRRQVVGVGNNAAGETILTLSSGDQLLLTDLGGRPTLNGNLTLGNDSQIRGFDINSPATAITAIGQENTSINDIRILSAGQNGLHLENMRGAISISGFSVSQAQDTGILLSGLSEGANFGDTTINNSTQGLVLDGSIGNVTFNTLNISGTRSPESLGVNMASASGKVEVKNGGTIENVTIGFNFDANSDAILLFQNGTINAGIPINTVGVTQGSYDFTGVSFIKDNNLSLETGFGNRFYFVDATGNGDGTPDNPTHIDFVEDNASEGDFIFLVKETTGNGLILATDGLQLRDRQTLQGFTSDAIQIDFTGKNPHFIGDIVYSIADPTSQGTATLGNSPELTEGQQGFRSALRLANNVQLSNFNVLAGNNSDGILGQNFSGASLENITIQAPEGRGFVLKDSGGKITISGSNIIDAGVSALVIRGGNPEVTFKNSVLSGQQAGNLIDISDTTTDDEGKGGLSIDATSTVLSSDGEGLRFNNVEGNYTFDGIVDIHSHLGNGVTLTRLGNSNLSFNILNVNAQAGTAMIIEGGTVSISGGGVIRAKDTGILVSNTTILSYVLDELIGNPDFKVTKTIP